jgi:hypothetical protein
MTHESELLGMLGWLDVAIEREILRLRGRYQLSLDEFRGLYVSDEQVDSLLRQSGFAALGEAALPSYAPASRWKAMASRLGFEAVECAVLLVAIAGELDSRYPPLFAYLNDDAARRRPTLDLAMRLLAGDWPQREAVRAALAPEGRLRRSGAVQCESDGPASLLTPIAVSPLLLQYLLGGDPVAALGLRMAPCEEERCADAVAFARALTVTVDRPIAILEGPRGTGRTAFAAQAARESNRGLVLVDLAQVRADLFPRIDLAARLADAALLVGGNDPPEQSQVDILAGSGSQVFLSVPSAMPWERALAARSSIARRFAIAPADERRRQWRDALKSAGVRAPPSATEAVASRFRLSRGAIARAARQAQLAAVAAGASSSQATTAQLMAAAREQCAIDLGALASRIDARPGWDDLVVPAGVLEQLKDFASAGAQRDRVYAQWGMGSLGRGIGGGVAALFAGSSGTGKTMSAAVIARAVGLDLWRIDLSSVVSKYIGETEKNLERIFSAARDGDAILFFDEADALFGKRSEVKDAHDRYANVEVAYLLQKLEEFEGISILASNFSRNIDQAFVRRLHYIVEFPLPDEKLRQRLWRKAFSDQTPLDPGVDYAYLGNSFVLAGGDIRSAALDAAFLAASSSEAVGMKHIVRAVSRQLLKQGQLPGMGDLAVWSSADRAALEAVS